MDFKTSVKSLKIPKWDILAGAAIDTETMSYMSPNAGGWGAGPQPMSTAMHMEPK